MSLRKKKVEDALSKLFSPSKQKSPTAEASLEEEITHAGLPQREEEDPQPSNETKPASEKTSPTAAEKPTLSEGALDDIPPSEEVQLQSGKVHSAALESALPQATGPSLPPSDPPTPITRNNANDRMPPIDPFRQSAAIQKNAPKEASDGSIAAEVISSRKVSTDETCQLVIFTLAGEAFGLPIDRVESIIKPQAITIVPHARPYVVGVTNLRGTVLPVIDLRRRFQLPLGEKNEDQRIMVVLSNEEKIGLQVDSVTQVLSVPLSAIEPPPPLVTAFVNSAFVTGIANVDERLVILLDLEKVLLPANGN